MKKQLFPLLFIFSLSIYAQEVEEIYEASDEKYEILENIPFRIVAQKPVFPGCEEEDKIKCTHKLIKNLFDNNFNKELKTELNLENTQNIFAQFTIDTSGNIVNIQVRSPHQKIDIETKRVIKLLPVATPGKQDNKEVTVKYTLQYSLN
ncbi:hypothetical protein HN014_17695 [Aquimarina sp. TRL1]|uniref:energy transducer TonB n=1 Tax=Aquimarina sp. (strain TRL1) TaxID=2736252 RepID=UPI00158989FE|nr:energy transducer TonB [Aquimarina sp. TRL1]QKX06670.1 hypothetical protein HN014_17695 [Aquimarina sp. TRL1]